MASSAAASHLAVEWEVIPVNPSQGVKPPKVPPGRVRYLQPTELHAVLAARYQHLSPAFMAEAVGRLDAVFGLESPLEVPKLPEAVEVEAVCLAG